MKAELNIKKIIAREGLILLSFILLGLLIGTIFQDTYYSNLRLLHGVPLKRFGVMGERIMLYGYPFYLLIRFVLWAIKTLKGEITIKINPKRLKKIIAREGLILLVIIGMGYIIMTTPELYIKARPIRIEKTTDKETPIDLLTEMRTVDTETLFSGTGTRQIYRISEWNKAEARKEKVKSLGFIILFFGYPIYLLIRFILWGIRTLRKNE